MKKKLLAGLATGIFMFAVNADASTVYISDNWLNLYSVDTSTWAATKVGQTASVMTDIAFDSSGNLYGISSGSSGLFSIDTQNANSVRIGTAIIASANALAFSPSGDLYAANIWQRLFSINVSDGTITQLPGVLPRASSGDLEFDSSGNLYMAGDYNPNDQFVRVNVTPTVSGSVVGSLEVQEMYGLAYADDTMYGFSGQNAYSIDLDSGATTLLGGISGMDANRVIYGASTSPVPLPGAVWLLSSGLLGLVGIRRKMKQ